MDKIAPSDFMTC